MKLEMNNRVNFNLYKAFYVVASTKNLTLAAKELNVSQPALSYSIKQLEEQLNVSLFYRKNKGVFLTKEGELLYDNVYQAFQIIINAENQIENKAKDKDNTITIGTLSYIADFYVSDLIAKLLKINPNINVKIVENGTNTLMTMLDNKEIDIMFDIGFKNNDKKYASKIISEQKYCFAGVKELMDNDFNSNNFILPAIGAVSRKVCDDYFLSKNINIKPKIEVFTTEAMLSFVKKGLGVGFFLENSIKKELDNKMLYKKDIDTDIEQIYLNCVYLNGNENENIKLVMGLI